MRATRGSVSRWRWRTPISELTGLTAANDNPDFVSRLRWQPGPIAVDTCRWRRWFDSFADFLERARRPRHRPGWGVQFSGDVRCRCWTRCDRLLFQVKRGDGIGHYINDLNAEGGQDGVFDAAANVIRVLPARAGVRQL